MSKKLFAIMVVSLCTLGLTGYAMGQNLLLNAGFETWTAGAGGPPDNWYLSLHPLTGSQESVIVNSGTYSCNLTWTTITTCYLQQDVAVTAGQDYEFSYWAYDNDPYGRFRVYIRWYQADNSTYISAYQGGYTTDQAVWQQLASGTVTAPPLAGWAHCEIRCYDVSWLGTATCYADDAVFEEVAPPPPPDTLEIYEIQYTTDVGGACYDSPYDGEIVVTSGVVTYIKYNGFWMQDSVATWNGINMYTGSTPTVNLGDEVLVTGTVDEYWGVTQLGNVTDIVELSTGNPDPILDITTGDLADSCDVQAEAFESVLVKVSNVLVTDEIYTGAKFLVDDGTGKCIVDDYFYGGDLPLIVGNRYDITGVVGVYNDEYMIYPRDIDDLNPLAIELASFDAAAGDGQVTLAWRTASEVDNFCFNIYRDDEVIASVPAFGDAHDYIYVDRDVENGTEYSYQLSDVNLDGTETIHPLVCSVTPNAVPVSYALAQNYPNPFNPSTEISYAIPADAHVTLTVYNLLGQEMVTLVDDTKNAGRHTISWNAADNASGVYFYRLQTDDFSATKKMVFMK